MLELEQWTIVGIKNSSNEAIGNKEGRQLTWHRTLIFPIYFHHNRMEKGKDDSSSDAHV
jgi:hypothetical protein